MRSAGTRFIIVGLLALFMFIPLFFAGVIIGERGSLARSTAASLGQEWGGPQVLSGPELIIPVSETITTRTWRLQYDDQGNVLRGEDGKPLRRNEAVTKREDRAPLVLLPSRFDVTIDAQSDVRSRGIFDVPVYRAETEITFDFDTTGIALGDNMVIHWEQAALNFGLSSNRALRGDARLTLDGTETRIEPRQQGDGHLSGGITADIGDPRSVSEFVLSLGFQGTDLLKVTPVGRTTRVTMTSDWPHPSFSGSFLPDHSDVNDEGFRAEWTIPHLARSLPSRARESQLYRATNDAFGVRFYQANDFYQKAYRAARYGIMFIALTFLSVLLIEGRRDKPTHPLQYIFIGLAQSMFVVLMVAYAEQIGFGAAYALASVATVGLITMYGWVGLRLGARTWLLGAVLASLYGLLFLILRSADYALLAGATVLFLALAGTMFGTRNEDWYGSPNGPRWFRRVKPAVTS